MNGLSDFVQIFTVCSSYFSSFTDYTVLSGCNSPLKINTTTMSCCYGHFQIVSALIFTCLPHLILTIFGPWQHLLLKVLEIHFIIPHLWVEGNRCLKVVDCIISCLPLSWIGLKSNETKMHCNNHYGPQK